MKVNIKAHLHEKSHRITLKVKSINISTGGIQIVVIHYKDAFHLDLHPGDRIEIHSGNRTMHVIVDVSTGDIIKKGEIGMFKEVADQLKVKSKDPVNVCFVEKPISIHYIKQKLQGKTLNEKQIFQIVKDIVENKLSDIEITYFTAAGFMHGFNEKETVALTKAMINTGERLKINKKFVADKHCTGGVAGNRTTMIVVPIVAAAGISMPKTSSRAITSPAGTADTMEVLTPVSLELEAMKKVVKKINACIVWGGAMNLAPADDRFIQVESPLSIDAEGQLLASIIAKKGSVSASHILIDIPVGNQTKIKTRKKARELGGKFKKIGKLLGMHMDVIITEGNEPIGNGIGPTLEARDVLKVLQRSETRPLDLEEKSIMMAARILEMCKRCKKGQGRKLAQSLLDSKKALKKMKEIIKAQGGNPNVLPGDIKMGKYSWDYRAPKTGVIKDVNNHLISSTARFAGAPIDKEAGLDLYFHEKQKVKKGERILTIYANSTEKLNSAKKIFLNNPTIIIK